MFDTILEIKEMHENSRIQIEKFDTQFSKFDTRLDKIDTGFLSLQQTVERQQRYLYIAKVRLFQNIYLYFTEKRQIPDSLILIFICFRY